MGCRRGGVRSRGTTGGLALTAVLVLAHLTTSAPATAAAAPANDRWTGAQPLSVGATVTEETRAATADRVDARANEACGAPFTRASVWFRFRPRTTARYTVDLSRSSYSSGVMVFRGKPSATSLVDCGAQGLAWRGKAGVTYYAMAFSDTRVRGGTLVLALDRFRRPEVSVAVDPEAVVAKSGAVTVTGTVSCRYASTVGVSVDLSQAVGRFRLAGYADQESRATCDGTPQPFALAVAADDGRFGGGKATVSVAAYACSPFACGDATPVALGLRLNRGAGGEQ